MVENSSCSNKQVVPECFPFVLFPFVSFLTLKQREKSQRSRFSPPIHNLWQHQCNSFCKKLSNMQQKDNDNSRLPRLKMMKNKFSQVCADCWLVLCCVRVYEMAGFALMAFLWLEQFRLYWFSPRLAGWGWKCGSPASEWVLKSSAGGARRGARLGFGRSPALGRGWESSAVCCFWSASGHRRWGGGGVYLSTEESASPSWPAGHHIIHQKQELLYTTKKFSLSLIV